VLRTGERDVCLTGPDGSNRIDTALVLDLGTESELFTSVGEELRLVHEHREKVQEEMELERERKAQMREEERAQKEFEKAQLATEKEEKNAKKELDKAREELDHATGDQLQKLQGLVERLEAELGEALDRKAKAIARAQLTRSGHVYVLSNIGSFGAEVFKIGMTRRLEPLDRVCELGDASVPLFFDVHAMIYTEDAPPLRRRCTASSRIAD
jgi:DNA-directed RNA polymerase